MSTQSSGLRLFWTEFRDNKVALFALVVVILMIFLALFASLISPQNPYDLANLSLMDSRRPPGFVGSGGYTHVLGTDPQGRDLLSAMACALPFKSASLPGSFPSQLALHLVLRLHISVGGSRH